jgi:hypothetical protein
MSLFNTLSYQTAVIIRAIRMAAVPSNCANAGKFKAVTVKISKVVN